MDRYTFRGKRLDNGEWVYGAINSFMIVPIFEKDARKEWYVWDVKDDEWIEVDPATIGQCTGIKDKNGNLIYEGDIVTVNNEYVTGNLVVWYSDDECRWALGMEHTDWEQDFWDLDANIAIVGNRHDGISDEWIDRHSRVNDNAN